MEPGSGMGLEPFFLVPGAAKAQSFAQQRSNWGKLGATARDPVGLPMNESPDPREKSGTQRRDSLVGTPGGNDLAQGPWRTGLLPRLIPGEMPRKPWVFILI